jgi:hypothetical protein
MYIPVYTFNNVLYTTKKGKNYMCVTIYIYIF